MRYMGDPLDDMSNAVGGAYKGPLPPALKAQMVTEAADLDDARASDLFDVVAASHFGRRQKWILMAEGAAVAIAIGFVLSRLRKRR